MTEYTSLTIEGVDRAKTVAPPLTKLDPKRDVPYDVHIRLNRVPTDSERAAITKAWGSYSHADHGHAVLKFEGNRLIVSKTTIQQVRDELHKRIRLAVDAGAEQGARDEAARIAEARHQASHRAEVDRIAESFGW